MENVGLKTSYHHGDLKGTLIRVATKTLEEKGIEALSLRKLAEQVGVSRTAPYNHFKNKNQLLCAIAEQGFVTWKKAIERAIQQTDLDQRENYRIFARAYIQFAVDNPELYDLMYGRPIWKNSAATESLKEEAYPAFQKQLTLIRRWQQQGIMPAQFDAKRLAQFTWSTLHGLARLVIDGIYANSSHVEEMCDMAVAIFTVNSSDHN